MGSDFFNKIQYGKETTKGTPVAGTQMFIGQMPPIKSDRKAVQPVEHFGVRAESFRSVVHQYLYNNTLSVEHGAFQHLPLLFSSIKGGVTAAEQTTAQSDYLWDFTPSLTAANNPDAFTLRFGDDAQAYISEYCMFERIRISGQIAQGMDASPVKIEADVFGRQIQTSTFTGALTPRTLEPINAKLARLYYNDTWAAVGTTELDGILRSFDIEIITGVHPRFVGSALRTFDSHGEGIIGVMGTFGIEGGADAAAIFADQQQNDFKVCRLSIDGSQIGTGDNYNLTIDFGGSFEDASPISGADRGDNLAQFVIKDYYDKVSTKKLQVSVTTNHSAY